MSTSKISAAIEIQQIYIYIYTNYAIRNQTQCCVLGYAKYNQARTSPARVAGLSPMRK